MSKRVFERIQLESFRPCRVRRDWRGTLLTALTWLTLSALAGWLWSCVKVDGAWLRVDGGDAGALVDGFELMVDGAEAGLSTINDQPSTQLLAGVPDWVAFGIVATLVLMVLARLAWDVMVERAEADPFADDGRWDADGGVRAPREAMPAGLDREDVARIFEACADEVKLCRNLVNVAQRSMNVEDYGDALAGAEKRLGQLRVTLCELRARFDDVGGNAIPPSREWPSGAEREVVS